MKKLIFTAFTFPILSSGLNTRITLPTSGNYTDSSFDYFLIGFLGKLEFFDIFEGIGLDCSFLIR